MATQSQPGKKKTEQLSKYLSGATIREVWGHKKWKNLFAPVDVSSIVFFRVMFGAILLYEINRYIHYDWITKYWITPQHHFTYWPFDFVTPLPGNGMYILFYAMGIFSVCIIVGLFYRVSTILFFACFTYFFLLEQARYLNHFYLVVLMSAVIIFIPANTSASIDSKIFKRIKSETAPAWSLWLLRFMIGVPYFFGGVAKINPDWLQGQPLKIWLANHMDFPVLGKYFTQTWMVYSMSYTGLILDLFIVPALLFKRTRNWGLLLVTLFHLMNAKLFTIGIFPWFMLAGTSLYFSPDWPRRFINFFSTGNTIWPMVLPSKSELTVPELLSRKQKFTIALLSTWVGIQILVPLRHFVLPGNVHWTEEGHKYAWHMKLRKKFGTETYKVKDKKTGEEFIVDLNDYLNESQQSKMGGNPDLLWQTANIIKQDYKQRGMDVAVYVDAKATLNGRKYQQLIDSTVDLGSQPRPAVMPSSWILPLTTSLDDQIDRDSGSENEDAGQ